MAFFDRALRDLTWLYVPAIHLLAPWAPWAAYAVVDLAIVTTLRGAAPDVSRAWFVAAVAGAAGLTAAWWPLSRAGEPVYLAWRFGHYRPRYDAVVADATRGGLGQLPAWAWARRHGVELKVDSGPPLRVAFLEPGGLLDNWIGVVYDPS